MINTGFSQKSLVFYGTLNSDDVLEINKCRGIENKLGFTYQLIFIRLFNELPKIVQFEVIEEVLIYAAIQLGTEAIKIDKYQSNRTKISDHQKSIIEYLQINIFNLEHKEKLEIFLFKEALRLESVSLLKARAIQSLKESKILCPNVEVLNRMISSQRKMARHYIFDIIQSRVNLSVIKKLKELISRDGEYSQLERLKAPPCRASSDSLINLTKNLEIIKNTGVLSIEISDINSNYQKILTREIKIYSINRIRELNITRRNAGLICFLQQIYRETMDHLIETYMKLLNSVYKKSKRKEENIRLQKEKEIKEALKNYKDMKKVIRDKSIPNSELRSVLYKRFSKWLKDGEDELEYVINDKSENIFKLILKKYNYLRQFTPSFIEAVDLELEPGIDSDIIEAFSCLKDMNRSNKRSLLRNVPKEFVQKNISKFVKSKDVNNRHAWECSLLLKLKDEIKNSNIVVKNSKRFTKFQDYFMPEEKWNEVKEEFFRKAKLPSDGKLVTSYWQGRINRSYDNYLLNEKSNVYVKVENNKWIISKDTAEKLTEEDNQKLEELKNWLASNMRQIKLPDLLVEVDNDLRFSELFIPLNKEGVRAVEDICEVIVTIMSHGCNIGAYTMSKLVKDVSYEKIRKITDWQMNDEKLRKGLSWVVNALSKLAVSKNWGEGKTSSGDVHLVKFRERVLQQSYNLRFGDYALEFYTFVADNYAPYHSTPVESAGGEAAHALDGIYYNESDLMFEEHYTDTKAAATINFAAFAFAGVEYNPRIRGIQNHKIFKIEKGKDYGSLEGLLKHREAVIKMDSIISQWDRMAHFYASIAYGYSTASVSLRKLLSLNSKNEFYKANLQLGRILKTENTLKNMVNSEMRKRRQRGLLKGEEMHQLARDINYGNRGKITARDLEAQRNCCNCLTLIMACVIYWQAKEISRILTERNIPEELKLSLLEHISPIGWDNIVLYGEYIINKELIKKKTYFRESI